MIEQDRTHEILKRLSSGYNLPSLSPITVRLIELASDERSSVVELTELIEKDPSLAIRVLKLANSAFYKSPYPVTTLRQAIMRIGFHQLRILALSLSIKDTFPMGKVGNMDFGQFWKVSLYRGLLARSLAYELKTCEPEEAFFAGLTLEIGFLIFFDLFIKGTENPIDPGIYPLESLLEDEKRRFGINHREIGVIALHYWKFPEHIIECQSFYGEGLQSKPILSLPAICRIAGRLTALICYAKAGFQEVCDLVVTRYGLKGDTLYDALVRSLEEVEGIAENLNVQVARDKDMLALMEKANKALGELSQQIITKSQPPCPQDLPSFDALRSYGKDTEGVKFTLQAVAHEIRNPLTIVGGFVRRLARSMDPNSDKWQYMEIILKETKRLEQVLQEATQTLQG
ncbi:MAG: HDOD domain-containing protein [Syntrophorhabdaceae bacterium]|nr:HDOD domain-containing protein [Syntrophorhabdaceae bacterium]